MQEIEVKFKVRDFSSVRARLGKMGARMIWKGTEESIFFDTKGRDLYKKDILFRLRTWDNHGVYMAVKTPSKQQSKKYKIKDEFALEVHDFAAAEKMIKALGFVEDFAYHKYREHWQLNGAYIELDRVGRLHFVEIESTKKNITELARTLGLDWERVERRGYVKILQDISRRRKFDRGKVDDIL
ncbi:MAG: class IV adenylate cyclase [bacterium]|nr:class IV adenylate cyclase [bacterium]